MIKTLLLRDQRENCWLKFDAPLELIVAWYIDEVESQFRLIESRAKLLGCYAAGFISYEAAPGFDKALVTKLLKGTRGDEREKFPLLCFGLYQNPQSIDMSKLANADLLGKSSIDADAWEISEKEIDYAAQIKKIKALIDAGDTYQVNYTIRQFAKFSGDAEALFLSFATEAPYSAFLDLDDFAICSASPELFFERHKNTITTRPMKGTAHRGLSLAEDEKQRAALAVSEKDRAENIMIVDMIRNDLGKIARRGSVKVSKQFEVEKYPTVWQMTSTVSAETDSSLSQIMSALFPCASITGAPKVKTMSIINELEETPRDIYTGTIGFIRPDGDAQFNVAIRTALINKMEQTIVYGIGGGVIADSNTEAEYEECLLKAKAIMRPSPPFSFSLLESILWMQAEGYFLLDYHLARLRASAEYFDVALNEKTLLKALHELAENLSQALVKTDLVKTDPVKQERFKVRVLLHKDGSYDIESSELAVTKGETIHKVKLAAKPIYAKDVFLYHKTTHRLVYEQALENKHGCDDVLLWNEKGEITESSIANIVLRRGSKLITPPVAAGLLAGTFRQSLIDDNEIEEANIKIEEVLAASEIYLINSVRKWQRVEIVTD